ncbi:MAG: hypothetical protein WEB09_03155 [Nitriliruptor sp.]
MHRLRGALPLIGWLGSLAAGIVLFTALGDGPLATPPVTTPSAWGDWAAQRDAVTATVAILRLVVLALAWYLVAVTTVGLLARVTRAARLIRIADALSVPFIRQVLQGALGLSLAAGVVVSSAGPVTAPSSRTDAASGGATAIAVSLAPGDEPRSEPGGARMVAIGHGSDPEADEFGNTAAMSALEEAPTASMRAVDPATSRMVGLGPPGASTGAVTDAEAVTEVAAGDAADLHEVAPGEHLWSIAAAHLAAHLGHAPSETEIAAHWERLVELNRDRLANPDDPDLIFPGQRFELPGPPELPERHEPTGETP